MRWQKLFFVLVLVLCLPELAAAQLGRWGEESSDDFRSAVESGRFRPFIEGNYGSARPQFRGYGGSFTELGVVELKLGFASRDSVRRALVSLDERYAFASYFGEDIRPFGDTAADEITSKLTRFGAGNRLGYGYGFKVLRLELYNQNSLNWTRLQPVSYDTMDPEAQAIFDRYEDSFRFGQLVEVGLQVNLFKSLGVSAGVEGAVIFPRHVFWPWAGSAMIYSGVQGALQYFSEQIVRSSPVFGPIIHFVLKSAVSVGYYMGMRDDMNWPFDSETPMTVESAKLGLTFGF